MRKPLAIDLFCGLGGWTESLLAEGWRVIGFDIERHDYGSGGYPGHLVLQDVRTLHGAQFKDADLIVASPPCQEFSYRAMPWKRAKALPPPVLGINLFWQCWRIQHEACEAAGRYIPLVVENVKGAQPWVGRAAWHDGSFYLWGDVPALMPLQRSRKNNGGSWFAIGSPGQTNVGQNPARRKLGAAAYQPGAVIPEGSGKTSWFFGNTKHQLRGTSSGSQARKAASAQIAKIPEPLARHIAQVFKPRAVEVCSRTNLRDRERIRPVPLRHAGGCLKVEEKSGSGEAVLRAEVDALRQERDELKYRLQTWDDTNADWLRAEQRIPPGMTPERLEQMVYSPMSHAAQVVLLYWADWLRIHSAPSGEPTRTDGDLNATDAEEGNTKK